MDHKNPNTGHWLAVAFVAAFAPLRHCILVLGIGGMLAAGVVYWTGLGQAAVSQTPVCDRVWWVTPSQNDPLAQTGPFVRSVQGQIYVHEANGTGYCLLKHDERWVAINNLWQQKWWEVPTKYGSMIAPYLPQKSYRPFWSFVLFIFSGLLIVFLWLPATLLAMFGRRIFKLTREEHYEQF